MSVPHLLVRGNTTIITSANATNTTGPVSVLPIGITHTLPWWTSIIGGVIDFLIGTYTVGKGWKRQTPADCAWTLSPDMNGVKTITTAVGLFMTFFQAVSGIAHLRENWGTRDLVRKIGGNGYVGLFCIGAQMYSAKIRGRWMARVVAWIVAIVVIANFAEFTDPKIGTAPLYEVQSNTCVGILRNESGFTYNCGWYSQQITPTTFSCAKKSDLRLFAPHQISMLVNRIFIGVLGLFFVGTLIYHLTVDLEWLRWRRNGCPPLPQEVQPVQQYAQYPPYLQPQYQQYPQDGYNQQPYIAPKSEVTQTEMPVSETTDHGRDAYHPGNKNPHKYIAYSVALALFITNAVAAYAYAQTYYASKDTAVSRILGVCPSVGNVTMGNVTALFGVKGNCTCIDLKLPGELDDLGVALEGHGMLARLLHNI